MKIRNSISSDHRPPEAVLGLLIKSFALVFRQPRKTADILARNLLNLMRSQNDGL